MDTVKGLYFSCLHAPYTREGYIEWLCQVIRDHKPKLICNLGDWYEAGAASRFPKNPLDDDGVLREHRVVAEQARMLNDAAPIDSKLVWIYGNHDDNFFNVHPGRISKDIVPALHWSIHTDGALDGWHVAERYDDDFVFNWGAVTAQHGTGHSKTAEKDQAYRHARPNGLYVCGHTHRPLQITQAVERKESLPFFYVNPGTGVDWNSMYYMQRNSKSQWGGGAVLVEQPEAHVRNRRASFADKDWDAELLIHEFANRNRKI